MIKRLFLILAVAIAAVSISGCGQKQDNEEEIIYGDIDLNAEVVEQVKPKSIGKNDNVCGTTYLNLINDGLFCEDEENFYYVIKYEDDSYLVKQNKQTEELLKIYRGDVRNIFVINGWIYAIESTDAFEHMIVIDIYGNNFRKSSDFKREIRTMMSDGDRIYFTVDASNMVGGMNTYVYSYSMDFSELNTEIQAKSIASQMDIISIYNGKKYFFDSYTSTDSDDFKYTNISIKNKPIFVNNKLFTLDEFFVEYSLDDISAYNMFNERFYVAINDFDKSKIYIVNTNNEIVDEKYYDSKIDGIYEYSDGILIYTNGKFIKEKKNV